MNEEKRQLLETSYEYLIRLTKNMSKEIEDSRSKNTVNLQSINYITEGVQYLTKTVGILADFESLEKEGEIYKKVFKAMENLYNAMKSRDNTTIIDILEYEFLPILEDWKLLFFTFLAEKH